jgi:hypothetical protein
MLTYEKEKFHLFSLQRTPSLNIENDRKVLKYEKRQSDQVHALRTTSTSDKHTPNATWPSKNSQLFEYARFTNKTIRMQSQRPRKHF